MCFSPEADLVGAAVVGVVGIDTIRQVHDRRDWPLASLPALFAVHLLVEAFVWWGLQGQVTQATGRFATTLYLLIALVVVPLLVPLAVMLGEPRSGRRRLMLVLTVIGTGVGLVYLNGLIQHPFSAHIDHRCVHYNVEVARGRELTVLYVIASCGVLLASSSRLLAWFGVANLVAVVLLGWLMTYAFISSWCAWAAITSVVIDLHLRHSGREHVGGQRHADVDRPRVPG